MPQNSMMSFMDDPLDGPFGWIVAQEMEMWSDMKYSN